MAAIALASYGVGLPAFALVRIVASTFYARHDTGTPARVTVLAMLFNIVLKVVLVWGLHLGIAGIALGTSFGAWLNVVLLTIVGRKRGLLSIDTAFQRALLPVVLSAIVAFSGAWLGARFVQSLSLIHFRDELMLFAATVLGAFGYVAVVLAFRHRLPLGKLSKASS